MFLKKSERRWRLILLLIVGLGFCSELFSYQKIDSISYENIQKSSKRVAFLLRRDLILGGAITGIALYGSALPLIAFFKAVQTKKAVSVEETEVVSRSIPSIAKDMCVYVITGQFVVGAAKSVVSIGRDVCGYVASEQFFISTANGACAWLVGAMVQKVAGKLCYAQTVSGFSMVHAPWEEKARLVGEYGNLIVEHESIQNKSQFYKDAFVQAICGAVKDIEMVLGFIEYKIDKKDDKADARLYRLIQHYLVGRTNEWIAEVNLLLHRETFDTAALVLSSKKFFDEFRAEIRRGGW